MIAFMLALVGLNTLRRAATRSIRSMGSQTDVTNPPLDADLRQHLTLQQGRSTAASSTDTPVEMKLERAAPAAAGFGYRGGLNFCLEALTVEQLKSLCRDKKLAVEGNTRDLIRSLAQKGDI